MLLEMDIKFLNEMRTKNRAAYERKLRILGISDTDIPHISYASPVKTNPIFNEVHYMCGSPYAGSIKNTSDRKKQCTVDLYIDAENVGAQHAKLIMIEVIQLGKILSKKYYGRQKDDTIKPWKEMGEKHEINPILISNEPEKDKVDNKIKKDIRKSIRNRKCADEIVIVTSDGGYTDIIEEIHKASKKVTVIGEKKTPLSLRNAADKFIEISPLSRLSRQQ